jgi:integrase
LNLTRGQVRELESVKEFLDSKSTRSEITARNYLTGLVHFNNFLSSLEKDSNPRYTVETILQPLRKEQENIYHILNRFVVYESNLTSSAGTIKLNLEAVKSYLGHHDVSIIPTKFKRQVTVPKLHQEEETAIDVNDVRKILLACNIRRLKTFLLILASGGMRPVEALAIRLGDIDFSVNPTKIHIRAKFSKTRRSRDIYISDEATKYLEGWINWRYQNKDRGDGENENKNKNKNKSRSKPRIKTPDDLIFYSWDINEKSLQNPRNLYFHIANEFSKLLEVLGAGFEERKDDNKRHKVTLKSFRSFVYSTISDSAGNEYAEWFLGHAKSPYWLRKEPLKREIYRTKCMKHLTFLDFTVLEARGRSIEANLLEKDQEIRTMKEQIAQQSAEVAQVQQKKENEIQQLKEQIEEIRYLYEDLIKRNIVVRNLKKTETGWEEIRD